MDSSLSPRERLAQAAIDVVRAKGYAATRVEDICAAAGVTKGSFFHHFASKDEAARAAADHWADHVEAFFGSAPYQAHTDPIDRLLGYVDFRTQILGAPLADCACFAGTMIQELYETHPGLRDASARAIREHGGHLERLAAEALAASGRSADASPGSLSDHIQAVVQGALILAKAAQDPAPGRASLAHLRRYLEHLLGRTPAEGASP